MVEGANFLANKWATKSTISLTLSGSCGKAVPQYLLEKSKK